MRLYKGVPIFEGEDVLIDGSLDDITYEVLDFSCTHTVGVTERYLSKLFLGKRFPDIENWLDEVLEKRYGGSSRKAVMVSYIDALKRWQIMTGNK